MFIFALADQSLMHGRDAARAVDDEGGGQRIDAAIKKLRLVVPDHYRVVDLPSFDVRFDGSPAVVVERDSQDDEIAILKRLLKIDEPRNFDLAGSAPRGPEIQQNHFAVKVGQLDGFPGDVLQREVGRGMAVFFRLDRGLDLGAAGQDQDGDDAHPPFSSHSELIISGSLGSQEKLRRTMPGDFGVDAWRV